MIVVYIVLSAIHQCHHCDPILFVLVYALLLRALHSFRTWMHFVVVFISEAGRTGRSSLLSWINIFNVVVLDHCITGGSRLLHTWGQDLLQKLQVLLVDLCLVGEFDVKLNVQVAKVMVSI